MIKHNDKKVVILSAVRTPVGKYGGCFKTMSAVALGTIAAQEAMRSKNKTKQALAVAEIAKQRKKGTNGARQRVIERSASIIQKATGQDHPAITTEMLAKSNGER